MPEDSLPTYKDLNYNAFLQKTTRNLADTKNVPGSISAGTDIAQSNTDAGKLAEENTPVTEGALQASASVIANASNQITSISGSGVTVFSGASATSGARVVLNSTGLAGYDTGGIATFAIVAATGAASFAGAITASTIDIGGADATSFHVDVDGNIWSGAATFAGAPFKVSNAGALTASNVTITGGALDIGGADATSWHVDSSGNMWAGAATLVAGTTPLTVTNAGVVVALSFATGVAGQNRIVLSAQDRIELYDSSNSLIGEWNATTGAMLVEGNITCNGNLEVDGYLRINSGSAPSSSTNCCKLYYKDSDDTLHFVDENGVDKEIATV